MQALEEYKEKKKIFASGINPPKRRTTFKDVVTQ
jgi:hypothetical protein